MKGSLLILLVVIFTSFDGCTNRMINKNKNEMNDAVSNLHRQHRSSHSSMYDTCVKPDDSCAYNGKKACRADDYLGNKSTTVTGIPCVSWTSLISNPWRVSEKYGNVSYCRNVRPGLRYGPWCYTSVYGIISENENCFDTCPYTCVKPDESCAYNHGAECFFESYFGNKSTTVSGKQCMMWSSKSEWRETYGNINYCRNPPSYDRAGPWCFTSNKDWEFCFNTCSNGMYEVSHLTKEWSDARSICRQKGMELAIVKNRIQKCLLLDVVGNIEYTWIGLSDIDEEGHYKWVDGTPLNTNIMQWSTDRPEEDKSHTQNCALTFFRFGVSHSGIYDSHCSNYFPFACQKSHDSKNPLYDLVCENGEDSADVCKYCLIGDITSRSGPVYSTYAPGSKEKPYELNTSLPVCVTVRLMKNGVNDHYMVNYIKNTRVQTLCGRHQSKLILGRKTTSGKIEETTIDTHPSKNTSVVQLNVKCTKGSLSGEVIYSSLQMKPTEIDGDIFSIECVEVQ